MVDLNSLIKGLSSSGAVSGFAGGLAGTAVAGALTGKKGKKMAKSALKVGALAAVSGLAYTAYQRYRQNGEGTASGSSGAPNSLTGQNATASLPPPLPAAGARWDNIDRQRFESIAQDTGPASSGMLLVRAMIAAAAADGHMDNEERDRVFAEAERLELSANEKAALFDELRAPLDLQGVVAQVGNPETAIEVYAASLIAIDETRPEAQQYLNTLSSALQLPAGLIETLHQQVVDAQRSEAA